MKKLLLLVCLLAAYTIAPSQCKSFTKNNCLHALNPFISNGQLNAAKLAPGESAELQVSFSEGLKYRLLTCSSELLGEVRLTVFDKNKKKLFSDVVKENVTYWDFKAETSQELFVKIEVPKSESENDLVGLGCVTMLIGFQE